MYVIILTGQEWVAILLVRVAVGVKGVTARVSRGVEISEQNQAQILFREW